MNYFEPRNPDADLIFLTRIYIQIRIRRMRIRNPSYSIW